MLSLDAMQLSLTVLGTVFHSTKKCYIKVPNSQKSVALAAIRCFSLYLRSHLTEESMLCTTYALMFQFQTYSPQVELYYALLCIKRTESTTATAYDMA